GDIDNQLAGVLVQVLAGGVGGQGGTVARQRQAHGFGQAVHRVGGEHARAGTTGRASRLFDAQQVCIRDVFIHRLGDGVNQVQGAHSAIDQGGTARFHWAAGYEDGRDVQAQCGHEHAGGDLVAVGDADQRVSTVRIDHVLHRVRNQI